MVSSLFINGVLVFQEDSGFSWQLFVDGVLRSES
jgi:hypothetical protein